MPGRLDAMADAVKEAAECNNEFAVELYSQLMEDDGNMFFSPYSISTALGMVYAGARGKTEAEMSEALHFRMEQEQLHRTFGKIIGELNARSGKDIELTVANALWAQEGYPFLDDYLDLTKANYRATLEELNFKAEPEPARKKINDWVEKATREKIKNLIPPGLINEMTRLVLTNAIYFKGKWQDEFKPAMTKDLPFTLADGGEVDVAMMHRTGKYRYAEEEDFQVLEMRYSGGDLSMIVFLPKRKDGLRDFERLLTVRKEAGPTTKSARLLYAEKLAGWMDKIHERDVAVWMPRFKTTSSFNLNEVLKSMGMTEAFSMDADFSGMTGDKELYLSAVVHKAYVDVNEEGTEAAAATGAVMVLKGRPPGKPVVFRADHPFVFLIRDNSTGSMLFMGRVTDPTK